MDTNTLPPTIALEILSQSVDQTMHIGQALGTLLLGGDVICLSGDLGAGKTALTKGIGRGWGALEAVTSPTFTLIHEHSRASNAQTLHHIDCYRLTGPEDAWGIGLDDMLYDNGIVVLEWPENILDALPEQRLWIALDMVGEEQRAIRMIPSGTRYESLVEQLRRQLSV